MDDIKHMQRERQKKDNHNMSKCCCNDGYSIVHDVNTFAIQLKEEGGLISMTALKNWEHCYQPVKG